MQIEHPLLCPKCRGFNLHQSVVTSRMRRVEDGPAVSITHKQDGSATFEPDTGAPGRRDSLDIKFWCEHCDRDDEEGAQYTLRIEQHKGTTFLSWVGTSSRVELAPPS